MAPNSFQGKIIDVDLSEKSVRTEKPGSSFYRKHPGGPALGTYYALKEIQAGADPLGPDNAIIISSSVLVGAPAPSTPRVTISAKSPLTGAIGKSEAGGFWGAEFKSTGHDALVITGEASEPSFIAIEDDEISIQPADDLWGKTTKQAEMALKERYGKSSNVLQIGPAGENQVRYANVCHDLAHFNGRNGMGAVMGSKNLKAIVVNGSRETSCYDKSKVTEITRWVAQNRDEDSRSAALHEVGTPGGIASVNASGWLPTRNWQEGQFEGADQIGSEAMEEILADRKGCYSCPVQCKRVVKVEEGNLETDPDLGGPEYETLGSLGSNLGIDDIRLISKANELCNKYTIDTISFGMTLSFAMHCFEEGLLDRSDTDGYELKFGNGDVLLPLIRETARQEGFGKQLGKGSARLAEEIGEEAKPLLREVKGQEIPMHDPRVKTGLGLQYAISSVGADHWAAQHDPYFTDKESLGADTLKALGIMNPVEARDLGSEKVRFFYYTNMLTLMYDNLGACVFGVVARGIVPLDKFISLVRNVTGWNTNLWELLKTGERAANMMRLFNLREGFSKKDDRIPEIFYEDFTDGPMEGEKALDKKDFEKAINKYYQMAGWDEKGRPLEGKLDELGIPEELRIDYKRT
ncbi:aldehyde ferredoxin oxidoreductase family protein [Candidatus Bipolaricaulota bacterium]|nr:aldehyde ferredoxin oxidoreductase family protein [Candidatus Bipolaricaulota bacterium]